MNKESISELHRTLLISISHDDLDNNNLLKLGTILLAHLKSTKKVIRELTTANSSTDTIYWLFIKKFIIEDLEKVINEINQRQLIEAEDFKPSQQLKFLDLVATCRLMIYEEEKADLKVDPIDSEKPVINLILE
jgi:hypothetical protein